MIPNNISRSNVIGAIREIRRQGVPPRRESKDYLLVFEGESFPPKYVISIANRHANGVELDPSTFSGGNESNTFLTRLGFEISGHACSAPNPSSTTARIHRSELSPRPPRHDERCPECKKTVRRLLERIFGEVRTAHALDLGTLPEAFMNSHFHANIDEIYRSLQKCRGHVDFVYARTLPPVDYFIPSERFIVEFDESQHFTTCRKTALLGYPEGLQLGFDRARWTRLCDRIHAQDNDPPYRDEQRAWYDTLRDFAPCSLGMKPTVRLCAREVVWCSLEPQNREDLERFERLLHGSEHSSTGVQPSFMDASNEVRPELFQVALVVPEVWAPKSSTTGSPRAPLAFKPSVPTASDFSCEKINLVVFPEAYIRSDDWERRTLLRALAQHLNTPVLVGVTERHLDRNADWETLVLFRPGGASEVLYRKHATAGAVAFEIPGWEPKRQLPVFQVDGVTIGCTICHDSYLGLLQRFLAKQGAQIWINPSYDNVIHEKWESILRLRAIEHKMTSLCTLHDNPARNNRRRIRPFGFSPDGSELEGRPAGYRSKPRRLSECNSPGIYIVGINLDCKAAVLDPSMLPISEKLPFLGRRTGGLVRLALIDGIPHVQCKRNWVKLDTEGLTSVGQRMLGLGVVPGEKLFDSSSFVEEQVRVYNLDPDRARPIFWNQWLELPTDPRRLADMMMGRTIEMFALVILSDQRTIYEVTEIAGGSKTIRRLSANSSVVEVDVGFALGLWNSFKITWASLADEASPKKHFEAFVQKYLSLL